MALCRVGQKTIWSCVIQPNLSSLNIDVLLHLMKFIKPVDRFNLVLSGVMKKIINFNVGIDLRRRLIEYFILMQYKCN